MEETWITKGPLQAISQLKSTSGIEQVGLQKPEHRHFQMGLGSNAST